MDISSLSKEEYVQIVSDFLHQIDFHMPSSPYDFTLEGPVMDYFEGQFGWPIHLRDKAVGMAKWMSTGLGMCYPFAERHIQIAYGIHATYVLFIDDIVDDLVDALKHFEPLLILGKPQKSPILQSFVQFLQGNRTYMGPYASAMTTKATIEFINGCILERSYDGEVVPIKGATKFPGYFRERTGYTEPYAHFCFTEKEFPESEYLHVYLPAIQDLIEFINYTNDILSFYKESIAGPERLNYICNVANTHSLDVGSALRLVSSQVVQNVRNVRTILKDHPNMVATVDTFCRGYNAWYLNQKRYMLTDVVIKDSGGDQFELTPTEPQGALKSSR